MRKRNFIALTASSIVLASCTKKNEPSSESRDLKVNAIEEEATTPVVSKINKLDVPDDRPLSFNEHIQPILSASCYHCHGPDSGTRYPEDEPLRLDTAEGAFAVRESGKPVIIKGDPDNSYLLQLMESKDKDMVMPPDPSKNAHGKVMDPEEIALVRRWIKEGAEYEAHWAYIAPEKKEFPEVEHREWTRNAVDHFVLSKMERAGLKPSEDEDRAKLLRRLSLDITGLVPSAEETKQFVSDTRDLEVVYEEKVDALLNSDAYAENFARHWLDVARYADTHGIHIDNYRSIWPYRDWVIEAFRKNMPFDQFTREQIAGDMMPNASLSQVVATGFHRCLPTTGEGGAIEEEYEAIYAQDRVNTTSAAWLGLTAGCAACHDHKFDAISTKENYEFTAFFRNTTMTALDGNNGTHPPNILIPSPEDQAQLQKINTDIAAREKSTNDYIKGHESDFQAWLAKPADGSAKNITLDGVLANLPLSDKSLGVNHPEYKSSGELSWVAGVDGNDDAVHFTEGNTVELGNVGDFERDQSFSYGAWIKLPKDPNVNAGVMAKMDTTASHRGYDLWLESGKLAVHLIHQWPQNFLKVTTKQKFAADSWMHVLVTYDGTSKADGVKIYVDGVPQALDHNENKLTETIKTTAPFLLGARYGNQPFNGGSMQDFQLYGRTLTHKEALKISGDRKGERLKTLAKNDANSMNSARDYYFTIVDEKSASLLSEKVALNTRRENLSKNGVLSLVMEEKKDSKPTAHILIRGDYSSVDKEVLSPGVPASLPPMTDDMPKNRLGLAMWLTDPANPLPARVTVNRYWSYFFGSGIVKTNSDFGIMGARPTHPKLLDWLAKDFVENGWDTHKMIKNIVMSSTYRQNSDFTDEKLARDPENVFLSRGPRYRMDAEQLRDLALSSSGLLIDKIGGPPVKPYQPDNVWSAVAMTQSNTKDYTQDHGEKLYRRSIYTFIKRTAIHPSMEILNAPSREESCVQRELTNTPLQAFVLMNDPQFIESARQLAAKALADTSDVAERIDYISMRLLSRKMSDAEHEIITSTLEDVNAKFSAKPEDAGKIVAVGESKAPANLDTVELASWTIIANQIFNMDETLNK